MQGSPLSDWQWSFRTIFRKCFTKMGQIHVYPGYRKKPNIWLVINFLLLQTDFTYFVTNLLLLTCFWALFWFVSEFHTRSCNKVKQIAMNVFQEKNLWKTQSKNISNPSLHNCSLLSPFCLPGYWTLLTPMKASIELPI